MVLCTLAITVAQVTSIQAKKEEHSIGEISPVIFSIAKHYPRLFKAKMVHIYKN